MWDVRKRKSTRMSLSWVTGRVKLPITKAGNLCKETELKSGVCFRHTEFWMHFTYIHPETMRSFPHQSSEFKSGEVWATGGKTTTITTKKTETAQRMDGYLKTTGVDGVTLNEKR